MKDLKHLENLKYVFGSRYGLNVHLPLPCWFVEALIANMMAFGGGAYAG